MLDLLDAAKSRIRMRPCCVRGKLRRCSIRTDDYCVPDNLEDSRQIKLCWSDGPVFGVRRLSRPGRVAQLRIFVAFPLRNSKNARIGFLTRSMESQPVRRNRQAFNGLWRAIRRIEFLSPARFDGASPSRISAARRLRGKDVRNTGSAALLSRKRRSLPRGNLKQNRSKNRRHTAAMHAFSA